MKTFRTLLALLLMFAAILSLGAVAFAEDVKTETKTYKDKNGETVIEVYDEDGELIHVACQLIYHTSYFVLKYQSTYCLS